MKTHFPSKLFNAACFLECTTAAELAGILRERAHKAIMDFLPIHILAQGIKIGIDLSLCPLIIFFFNSCIIKVGRCLQNLQPLLP